MKRVQVIGFVFVFLLLGNSLFYFMEFYPNNDAKSIAGIYELDFFGISSVLNIKWGHAVNTIDQLSGELANDSTQMIEVRLYFNYANIL
jgi:hypothetical protein